MSKKTPSRSAGVSSSATGKRLATAVGIEFSGSGFRVVMSDGRALDLRYEDFPFLRDAATEERSKGVIDAKGTAIWWEELLEGISVAGLIGVSETELEDFAGVYRR